MSLNDKRVVIASAGSRKTTLIVEEALALVGKRVLITTYTNENLDQIKSYFVARCGHVPAHVTLISWFSFLLHDGVRPYQSYLMETPRIETVYFGDVTNKAAYAAKADYLPYYITGNAIYRDKVADFVCHSEQLSGGLVSRRIERVYDHIFIDEMQDLSGYDLEILKLLCKSKLLVTMVGDPRQGTFSTNNSNKNKQFKKSGILDWIRGREKEGLFVVEERRECYRCNQAICDFADDLFPELPRSQSKNSEITGHDGIFPIQKKDAAEYFKKHSPMVLRWNKSSDTLGLPAMNFGASKGRTYDRVLIFATGPMKEYLKTKDLTKAGDLAKFYVAVTRARFSVAFVL